MQEWLNEFIKLFEQRSGFISENIFLEFIVLAIVAFVTATWEKFVGRWVDKFVGLFDKTDYLLDYAAFYGEEMEKHRHRFVPRLEEHPETRKALENDVVKKINKWIKSRQSYLILTGEEGSGKSRACISASEKYRKIKFINLKKYGSDQLQKDLIDGLSTVVKKNMVLIFEDYQKYDKFFPAIKGVTWQKAKLIIVTSPLYAQGLKQAIDQFGNDAPQEIKLADIQNNGQIIEVMAKKMRVKLNPERTQTIQKISRNNPGIARIALNHLKKIGSLEEINEISELAESIVKDFEKQWKGITPILGRLALLGGMENTLITKYFTNGFADVIQKLMSANYVVRDKEVVVQDKEVYQLIPDFLNGFLAWQIYFNPDLQPNFEVVVDEFITTKSRQILKTLINLDHGIGPQTKDKNILQEAAQIVLRKAKDLDAKTVIDLGIDAYTGFGIEMAQSNLGDFWKRVYKLADPDDYYRMAALLFRLFKWDEAKKCLEKAFELCKSGKNQWGMGLIKNQLGWIQHQRNRWDYALEIQNEALEIYKNLGRNLGDLGTAKTYNHLGSIFAAKGDWVNAKNHQLQALKTYEALRTIYETEGSIAQSHILLGSISHSIGDWNQAILFYEKACKSYQKLGRDYEMATGYSHISLAYGEKGDWNNADQYYKKALKILNKSFVLNEIAELHLSFGWIYVKKSHWKKGKEYFQSARDDFIQLGNNKGVAEASTGLGSISQSQKDWDRALEFYEKAYQSYEALGSENGKTHANLNLGTIYREKGDWPRAIQIYDNCIKVFEQLGDRLGIANTRINLGSVYLGQGDWDRAFQEHKNALKIYKDLGNGLGMANAKMNLAAVHKIKGELDRADPLFLDAYSTYEKFGNIQGMAQAVSDLGEISQERGEWDQAMQLYKDARTTLHQLGDHSGVADANINIGTIHLNKGEWDQAVQKYNDAFKVYENLGNIFGMATVRKYLAMVFFNKAEWKKAIQANEKARVAFDGLGNIQGMAQADSNLGLIHEAKGEWDRALQFYESAQRVFEKLKDPSGMADSYRNIGRIHLEKKNLGEAVPFHKKGLLILEKMNDPLGIALNNNDLGRAYFELGKLDEAIKVYEISLDIAQKLGFRQLESYVLSNIGSVRGEEGNWDVALDYFQKSLKIANALSDPCCIACTYGDLGSMYMKQRKWTEAEKFLRLSFKNFSELGAKGDQSRIRGLIQNLIGKYQELGDDKSAQRVKKFLDNNGLTKTD